MYRSVSLVAVLCVCYFLRSVFYLFSRNALMLGRDVKLYDIKILRDAVQEDSLSVLQLVL